MLFLNLKRLIRQVSDETKVKPLFKKGLLFVCFQKLQNFLLIGEEKHIDMGCVLDTLKINSPPFSPLGFLTS